MINCKRKKNWENGEIEYELLLGANKDYCEFFFVMKLFFWLFILTYLWLKKICLEFTLKGSICIHILFVQLKGVF